MRGLGSFRSTTPRRECPRPFPLNHQPNEQLVVRQRDQVARFRPIHVACDIGSIVRTDPESHDSADIAKQRIEDFGLDLGGVLVRQRKRETVFA